MAAELTLVVAATARDMGIGAAGGLPWTGLRKEMAYFARVTKRAPHGTDRTDRKTQNAVVMGRKTWDSIPPRYRPLPGRLNVVISRAFPAGVPAVPADADADGPVQAASLEAALAYLAAQPVDRTFVIGGAQIYAAALRLPAARRVLLTRVHAAFACDTFFPVALGADAGSAEGWVQRTPAEHASWVGEDVGGVHTENGIDYAFEMWEKVDDQHEP